MAAPGHPSRDPSRDLSAAIVRRLYPGDRAQVLAHFRRLDPETRTNRFMGGAGPGGVAAYAARAVAAEGVMFGAFADGVLRGLGELRPAGAAASPFFLGTRAEAAFTVERGFRRRGLGGALFSRTARAARCRGVSELHVRCFSWNGPMLRLAARHGAAPRREGSEAEGAVRLAAATPFSLWREGIAEAIDLTLAVSFPARPPAPEPA